MERLWDRSRCAGGKLWKNTLLPSTATKAESNADSPRSQPRRNAGEEELAITSSLFWTFGCANERAGRQEPLQGLQRPPRCWVSPACQAARLWSGPDSARPQPALYTAVSPGIGAVRAEGERSAQMAHRVFGRKEAGTKKLSSATPSPPVQWGSNSFSKRWVLLLFWGQTNPNAWPQRGRGILLSFLPPAVPGIQLCWQTWSWKRVSAFTHPSKMLRIIQASWSFPTSRLDFPSNRWVQTPGCHHEPISDPGCCSDACIPETCGWCGCIWEETGGVSQELSCWLVPYLLLSRCVFQTLYSCKLCLVLLATQWVFHSSACIPISKGRTSPLLLCSRRIWAQEFNAKWAVKFDL